MKSTYYVSFRCYFTPTEFTRHYQRIALKDIPKWIEAYMFTHPNVEAITVKVWAKDGKEKA